MLLTIITFLAILIVLVLSHEFGHFIFAKLAKVRVEEFAFGFPPRIFSVKKGETKYSFNLVPLGGYVKIYGEEGEEAQDPRSFSGQKFLTKVLIIAAGVLFNFLLAYILFTSGFMIGTPIPLSDNDMNPSASIQITEVQRGSPAQHVGLEPGDRIMSLLGADQEGIAAFRVSDVQKFIKDHRGQEISINYARHGEVYEIKATPRVEVKEGEGALGIAMIRTGVKKLGFFQSFKEGFSTTIDMTRATAGALLGFFKEIFTGRASFEGVSGPVGIANLVGDFSRFGIIFLIQLTALLSINLALINIIPFPGLDGGRIFFLLIEKIKGSPFHWKFTRTVHAAGFIALIIMMILITYQDILKLN
ncbi:RIP metalloprotease RseP [Candidatus Giovannonibacteria bacterium RIFCSPLOWO2_02_FULL_43_11b]|uniref:Zinc metalloprotease n=1 Tax=Candidatus Giovannonibacteria bacterium RIFCSPHIGHO2_12_FULL_43_15 TaxID=1798341 RepID=A0A1F5WQA7_9BACT|nr:MAG: RIP metalloprotease RseP [Candidatus Giovannonibacteria bacterium RIFCSPHIGHO2_01_FULL_43_100]OGF67296.1 MAG: RIP metalloprotease RseP [Candidatus Giovannonibacteria bacterium RIFCSPHIGHO2_02_FULL_43_32]OGF77784.1 MAG: RIP metalloprotease RseP [Candidatus Giovannonibacteria bacterium RIFCSPHIGHO2_12_FULL_43_15]OGF78577.1 MAG: RIP metalloprotease RseP [Candidatus Giovannonibacteria bacterium RIFCSPLOWO2_01_FULL_43_60]OGF90014.1 MAG: RIP metalloprotease RseP [Candidatus Giovannonibacteria